MGFLKKDSDFSSGEHFSVVSAECYFQGTLGVQGSLRVDGTLEGSVNNARHVIIGSEGKITGDVTGDVIVCGGQVTGNICAETLEMLATASVEGDIRAKKMVMAEGCRINGLCVIGEWEERQSVEKEPKPAKTDKAAKAEKAAVK